MVSHAFDHECLIKRSNNVNSIVRVRIRQFDIFSTPHKAQIAGASVAGDCITRGQVTVEMIVLHVLTVNVKVTVGVMRTLNPYLRNEKVPNVSIN